MVILRGAQITVTVEYLSFYSFFSQVDSTSILHSKLHNWYLQKTNYQSVPHYKAEGKLPYSNVVPYNRHGFLRYFSAVSGKISGYSYSLTTV